MVIEKLKVFDRNDRWNKYFNFSYICFGIDLDGIRNFLQIRDVEDENYEPVPHERKGELKELIVWIYGSKRDKKPPVVMNQNPHLRQLDAVVSNSDALDALRSGGNT